MKKFVALFLVGIMLLSMPVMASESPSASAVKTSYTASERAQIYQQYKAYKLYKSAQTEAAKELISSDNREAAANLIAAAKEVRKRGRVEVNGVVISYYRFYRMISTWSTEQLAEFFA